MRFLPFLVLLSALAIASCAAFFSIIGLKLLFVGGGVSIVVMGASLEVGKMITVSFLHQSWKKIKNWLKAYLIIATLFLMAITSIGIYGYLSAGYNATSVTVNGYESQISSDILKIKGLEEEISYLKHDKYNEASVASVEVDKKEFVKQQMDLIDQKNRQIDKLRLLLSSNPDSSGDITAAKQALDAAKEAMTENINNELEQIKLYNNRLDILDQEVKKWLDEGRGSIFRKSGLERARETKELQKSEREQIDAHIKESQHRIDVLRGQYDAQVKEYNARVSTIENRADSQKAGIESSISALQKDINDISLSIRGYEKQGDDKIASLSAERERDEKTNADEIAVKQDEIKQLNTEVNSLKQLVLKTDVGTFKFIAKSLNIKLDNAVNYFVWLIMVVFDPLAVSLILAYNVLVEVPEKETKPTEKLLPESSTIPADSPIPTPSASESEIQPEGNAADEKEPVMPSHSIDTSTEFSPPVIQHTGKVNTSHLNVKR